jgi:hypothetical protein
LQNANGLDVDIYVASTASSGNTITKYTDPIGSTTAPAIVPPIASAGTSEAFRGLTLTTAYA